MMLTNRGAVVDTWASWRFYNRVRPQFLAWNHAILTFENGSAGGEKMVKFVDDAGNILELHGIAYGYDGGTPGELAEKLIKEGFQNPDRIRHLVYNTGGGQKYPMTISRDSRI
ncbi:hypothetical protein [Mycobacterium aquaticum]|uniref:Uncharacterized protein n=1 Tax=Mycobacterium aquaticum TaxID=1927124 RepID=A0A1X0A2S0_9MYCO|nr:hypothetical protein [Mycobacterium aquaticum]ORA24168.1 hypothetical protein BST13_34485 [Mycobacterium aquaticum]